MGFNKISRSKRDQTWKEDVVTNGLGRVEGIAVDWIAGRSLFVSGVVMTSDCILLHFSSRLNNFIYFHY